MTVAKLTNCFSEPKYLLRFLAIFVCICIATYQLAGCINKIMWPPTSTHNSFRLNQTMQYPSITVCSNPGFKIDKFSKYGLTDVSLPSYTSFWKQFNFINYTLDEFFADATYSMQEIIPLHGFDGDLNNLGIQEVLKLTHGRCFRFSPKMLSSRWEKTSGYCFYMKLLASKRNTTKISSFRPTSNALSMLRSSSKYGFHIYIHAFNERIADDGNQSNNFIAYVYVESKRDISYSLSASEYRNLPSAHNNCRQQYTYSKTMCEETCLATKVTNEVGCSAPWLESATDMHPRCACYDQIKMLLMKYRQYSSQRETICKCPKPCNLTIYTPHMNEAKQLDYSSQSAFNLFYLSNLVTVTEEIAVYDWSLFISDLGGSLGFLLGLSVLSIISMLQQIFRLTMAVCRKQDKNRNDAIVPALMPANIPPYSNVILCREKTYFNINDLYM